MDSRVSSDRHDDIETKVRHMTYAEMSQHQTSLRESASILEGMPTCDSLGENETMNGLQQKLSSVFSWISKHKYRQVKMIVDKSVKPEYKR